MKKNMGRLDRTIRLIVAAVFAFFVIIGTVEGVPAILLAVIAVILAVSAIFGFCPLYVPLGLSTKGSLKKGGATKTDV